SLRQERDLGLRHDRRERGVAERSQRSCTMDIVRGMLHVFHREHAGRPRRVLWILEEIGEPYELTIMNWEQGSTEEHRARQPLGRVPVVEFDAGYVFESAAICLHLADLYPDAGLIGGLGTYARALDYQWSIFAPS